MKSIFPRPIGKLRELGRPREWIVDALLFAFTIALWVIALLYC